MKRRLLGCFMQVQYRRIFAFLFLLVSCQIYLHAGFKGALDSIKVINIKSLQQKLIGKNKVLFLGDAEVLLDYKIHIFADQIELDKEDRTIVATSDADGFVKLENPDFLMLAEEIRLNLTDRTGMAKNLKIHVKEGFLSSAKAQKIDDQTWKMEHIKYTSCDRATPHWAFTAHQAMLYKNSVLKASGLLFKIGGIPVFAFPGLVFPLQNRAGSGFLTPRLSFDAELGFGFRQEYYSFLGPHCDTTIGFYLVEKKGFILSDEFRWAKSPDNFLIANSHYTKEWRALLEKKGKIVSATDKHYWIQGKYFQPCSLGSLNLQNLVQFDFGTDKRVGYHFLNDEEKVEDSFCNSATVRYRNKRNLAEFSVYTERSLRRQFVDCQEEEDFCAALLSDIFDCEDDDVKKREREEKVTVSYVPRYEWGISYYKILPHLFYRHDVVLDFAHLERRDIERFYINDSVESVRRVAPDVDVDTFRFLYAGSFRSSMKFLDQSILFFLRPELHLRSNVKESELHNSHCKAFFSTGVEWAFPERMLASSDCRYSHYIQPLIRWNYRKKFNQDHWHYIDKFDRIYPENRVEFVLQNNWQLDTFDLDIHLCQGYDVYNNSEIFPLRRCYNQKHLSPLRILAAVSSDKSSSTHVGLQLNQEYSWNNMSLLQAELTALFSWKKYDFFIAYLYQKEQLQKDRELLSDVPVFAKIGCTVPVAKGLLLHYNGNFFSKCRHTLPFFNAVHPLYQSVYLNYDGHCWGITLGFEEKRYRQYGKWKSERAITLSLRLESIGSFAQKFRRPQIHRAPKEYKG